MSASAHYFSGVRRAAKTKPEKESTLSPCWLIPRRLFSTRPQLGFEVSRLDTTTSMLGRESALPFAFAPTGFTRLMNHEGEP